MNGEDQPEGVSLPQDFPLIPVRDLVVFPHMILPLIVGREISLSAITAALQSSQRLIFLAAQKEISLESPSAIDIYQVGTVAAIMRTRQLPDGRMKVLVQGLHRGKITDFLSAEPYFHVKVECIESEIQRKDNVETEALVRHIREQMERIISAGKTVSPDILLAFDDLDDAGRISDLVAASFPFKVSELQSVLERCDVVDRLRYVSELLGRELELLAMQARIRHDTLGEIHKNQREFFLREQMKVIKNELGEGEVLGDEIQTFRRKIDQQKMSQEAREEALKQLRRLEQMHPEATEASVIRTYLDWLIDLPWNRKTENHLDLDFARKILDEDHYNMESVKERILEFLAVCKLKKEMKGPILCFIGPPGVGKTSLGKSIARAMGRRFARASLGGLRDEAEIRGHRRTYVGAMPGRIIQGLKTVGTKNPIFMLDEIDKLGVDMRGDPAAALLEVLDPEQNHTFRDYYLNVDFDLSQVLFIATANVSDSIPLALRDRMEIIHLCGYSFEEKMEIAKRYLVPRQVEAHGITSEQITFSDGGIAKLIDEYTREAGVRNLEREIGAICRKVAVKVASGHIIPAEIDGDEVKELLGTEKFYLDDAEWGDHEVGVSIGLAWTPYGGEVIHIEASAMPGKGGLILTGQLGEVMQESARAAVSFSRANSSLLGTSDQFFRQNEIHVHIPAGAIPKDGPSAGIPIAVAIISLLTGKEVRKDMAFTGEVTLKGRVLPVGGIKEKVLAAQRRHIKTVIMPAANKKDLEEVPKHLLEEVEIILVNSVTEVLNVAFVPGTGVRILPRAEGQPIESDSNISSA
ncbi:MAG: endopeptidase La [Deltaproteobacteria bacterium]|nr:endopeptidase La [Deltaproteobacteria bacterium]